MEADMPATQPTCPMSRAEVLDRYFIEHRAKLIDIAAFLDRVDRADDDGSPGHDDVRLRALRQAIGLLSDGQGERARRVLELFSDHSAEPIPQAGGKGAIGVDPNGDYPQA
jgi:hypothetical protein